MVTTLAFQLQLKPSKRPRTETLDANLPALTTPNLHRQILRTMISLNLSFRAMENEAFRTLLRMLNPDSPTYLPGRTKLRDLLDQEHKATMENLLSNREPTTKVSLATDCWTSPNHLGFLGLNVYYIDRNWKYQEKLIGFEPLSGSHTGQNLAEVVEKILLNWSGISSSCCYY